MESVRTVALAGHRSSGKTTLAEHLLATAGVVRAPGRVQEGTALLDFGTEERRRGCSLRLASAWIPWGHHRIELIDLPGSPECAADRISGLAAADGVVVVVDATAGIELGTEDVLERAAAGRRPVVVVLTKADRAADMDAAWAGVRRALGGRAVRVHLPFHDDEGRFSGVVSVRERRVLRFAEDGSGAYSPEPVPDRYEGGLTRALEELSEAIAGTDDVLLESYLEYFRLEPEDLDRGLRAAARRADLVPVLLASGMDGVGGAALLDAIAEWIPPAAESHPAAIDGDGQVVPLDADGPFVGQIVSRHHDQDGDAYAMVRIWSGTPPRSGGWLHPETGARFKVRKIYQLRGSRRSVATDPGPGTLIATWDPVPGIPGDTVTDGAVTRLVRPVFPQPQLVWALEAERADPGARERLDVGLRRLVAEDPCLSADATRAPRRLAGLTDAHLRGALRALRADTGLSIAAALPPVAYRETPSAKVQGVEGLHVRETPMGLVEEFGACRVDVAPQPSSSGNSVAEALAVDEEDLPSRYRPAIRQGIARGLERGPAGYPVLGVDVRLVGGRYDILSSTEEHFVLAGEDAVRRALEATGTAILEPWSAVDALVPTASVGEVIGDVTAHRGRVVGLEGAGARTRVRALLPDREIRTFPERLQQLTAGRGSFEQRASHYEPLPPHLRAEAIGAAPENAPPSRRGGDSGRRVC